MKKNVELNDNELMVIDGGKRNIYERLAGGALAGFAVGKYYGFIDYWSRNWHRYNW
ncbi:bacteriocin class II family protein [Oceanivirga salmonicida]|uniref:bacteriocin class II family protein n=1 Tax=Oceanivirga salmonicida TaxID=1769291 RepID=UPI0012E1D1DA|nr:bacteriocin class II family protein [Oceanivirga salmonicida]